ncbi:MAG: hypothetical protein WBF13_04570 [Candidatus Zixiibacteriota bacterium]
MNSRRKRKRSSKRAEKDPKTQTSLEAFRTFLGNKGSDIILRHTRRLFRTLPKRKTAGGFKSFFLSAGDKIKKGASAQEKFLVELFLRFSEIDSSLETLKALPVYLKHFPNTKRFVKAGITERMHMVYQIEHYLQEVYLLKCRMRRFLVFLGRELRKRGQPRVYESLVQSLQLFEDRLEGILLARGAHVHQRRYTDPSLYTLSLFDLVKANHQDVQVGYELLLFAEKARWLKWMQETNQLIVCMVDTIFSAVNEYVLEE